MHPALLLSNCSGHMRLVRNTMRYLRILWLNFAIGILLSLVTSPKTHFVQAQQAGPIPDGVKLISRLYSATDKQLMDLPYPVTGAVFDSQKADLTKEQARYVRIAAAFNEALNSETKEPSILKSPSNHSEFRESQRVRLVVWTYYDITDPISIVLIEALQVFVARTMRMRKGASQPRDGFQIDLGKMLLPEVTELEVELFAVTSAQRYAMPVCVRKGQRLVPGQLPCPTLIMTDGMLIRSLIDTQVVMDIGRFQSIFDPARDIINGEQSGFLNSGKWYGLPLISDTRLFWYNKTTLSALNLKAPPPEGNWGSNDEEWTWDAMINYAGQIKQAKNPEGFRFMGNQDEENKLISMITTSYGVPMFKSGNRCNLRADDTKKAIQNTIMKLYGSQNPLGNLDFIQQNSPAFEAWKKSDITDPLDGNFRVRGSSNQYWGPGMGFAEPGVIRRGVRKDGTTITSGDGAKDADIVPALMPGNSFYTTVGLSVAFDSVNPTAGYSIISWLVSPNNGYLNRLGQLLFVPPPYNSVQANSPWNDEFWSLHKTQIQRSQPFQGRRNPPISGAGSFVTEDPFRYMLMDIAFKGVDLDTALTRTCSGIEALAMPMCTGANVSIPVMQCDNDRARLTARQFIGRSCRVDSYGAQILAGYQRCSYVEYTSPIGISLIVLNGLGLIVVITLSILTHTVFPAIGAAFLFGAAYVSMGTPSTTTCILQVLLIMFGFILFFTMLAVLPFFSSTESKSGYFESDVRADSHHVAMIMSAIVFVNVALFMGWVFVGGIRSKQGFLSNTFRDLGNNLISIQSPICANTRVEFIYTLFAINLVVLIAGLGMSFTRLENLKIRRNAGPLGVAAIASVTLLIITFVVTDVLIKARLFGFLLFGGTLGASLALLVPKMLQRTTNQRRASENDFSQSIDSTGVPVDESKMPDSFIESEAASEHVVEEDPDVADTQIMAPTAPSRNQSMHKTQYFKSMYQSRPATEHTEHSSINLPMKPLPPDSSRMTNFNFGQDPVDDALPESRTPVDSFLKSVMFQPPPPAITTSAYPSMHGGVQTAGNSESVSNPAVANLRKEAFKSTYQSPRESYASNTTFFTQGRQSEYQDDMDLPETSPHSTLNFDVIQAALNARYNATSQYQK